MVLRLEQPEKARVDASDVYLAAGLASARYQIASAEQSSALNLTETSPRFASHPKHGDKTVGLTRFPDLDPAHLQTAAANLSKH